MKVILYHDHLRINLNMLEKIGAAKGSFHITYNNIVSAFSEPPSNLTGFKVAGTNLPKVLEIRTYLAGTQKEFWYIKKRKYNYLTLVLKSNFYSRVILETEKSQDLAKIITEKIENGLDQD